MTEEMRIAIMAINKWVFFGWNYNHIHLEWTDMYGNRRSESVPEFIANIKWTCGFEHILSKWNWLNKDGDGRLVAFYAELGNENRRLLLEYVMKHYNDERKII